ncbi:hypothetical protein [Roseivirga pacifica]
MKISLKLFTPFLIILLLTNCEEKGNADNNELLNLSEQLASNLEVAFTDIGLSANSIKWMELNRRIEYFLLSNGSIKKPSIEEYYRLFKGDGGLENNYNCLIQVVPEVEVVIPPSLIWSILGNYKELSTNSELSNDIKDNLTEAYQTLSNLYVNLDNEEFNTQAVLNALESFDSSLFESHIVHRQIFIQLFLIYLSNQ